MCCKSRLDYSKVEIFVKNNENAKLSDIGAEFAISKVYAAVVLKRLGFSYKKTFTYLDSTQEKRDVYQEAIKDTPPQRIVYIDESRIDMAIC